LILKILKSIKRHIQSNLKVPHPSLVAFGINTAITVVIIGLYSMADTGMIGLEDVEAAPKVKPRDGEDGEDGGE
jgi:hypothetical protein